jgi:hypothetical protein
MARHSNQFFAKAENWSALVDGGRAPTGGHATPARADAGGRPSRRRWANQLQACANHCPAKGQKLVCIGKRYAIVMRGPSKRKQNAP